jgi:nucleotide-binding universal stress UspA family protein
MPVIEGQEPTREGPEEQPQQAWGTLSPIEAEHAREEALRRASANWTNSEPFGAHGRVEGETRQLTERLAREERERRRAAYPTPRSGTSSVSHEATQSDETIAEDRDIPPLRPIKSILVTFDGSLFAERVLPYAEALGRMTGAELVVTYSTDRADLARLAGDDPSRAPSDRVASALERVKARMLASGLRVRARIVHSEDPARGVIALQRELDADLIAIATHARQGIDLALLGSVASAVVLENPGYTLVTPPRSPDMRDKRVTFSRILLPLDGSLLAESALTMARSLLTQCAPNERPRRLTLLYVAESHAQEADGATYLRQIQSAIERETGVHGVVFTKVRLGSPAETIVAEAGGAHAPLPPIARYDLLLMATHGRGGLSKWFYGSAANHAITYCDTCMLLARPASSD